VFWAVYCDLLIKELRQLEVGAHIAWVYMGASAYADDLVLVAPTRHAMQQMLAVCEDYANQNQILFKTHPNPQLSKKKCIFMIGKSRNLVKPAPLQLGGRDLPWVESANHLGDMLHHSGNMDHDASIARAKFIEQSVETRQAFSFASPAEIIRALQVYNSSHYGSRGLKTLNFPGSKEKEYETFRIKFRPLRGLILAHFARHLWVASEVSFTIFLAKLKEWLQLPTSSPFKDDIRQSHSYFS
jgi:hypothetical protein